MSFLTPLFLLGALAVALPVVFHLIRRTTRQRTRFSSLMFLEPSPPRLTQRSRLEHILLLVLRCAAVCLLALAFARPFFRRAVPSVAPSAAGRLVVLVDSSASMRRGGLWAEAREKAESVLRQTAPADQAAVFTFDRQMTPVMSFEQWNAAAPGQRVALATGKLAAVAPGWSGTHLGRALIEAAELLADAAGKPAAGPGRIVLISDLQEGSRLEPLRGYEWPKNVAVSVVSLKSRPGSNASLQWLAEPDDAPVQAAAAVRARVNNAADSRRDQFRVGWARAEGRTFAGAPIEVYVPPGQSRVVALPLPVVQGDRAGSNAPVAAAGQPSPPPGSDRILLQGDDEDFDNTVFVVPPETERLSVLYCGGDSEKDPAQPLYFLRRAFQETRRQAVQVAVCPPAPAAGLAAATFFVVAGPLPEALAAAVRQQVTAGKTVLIALRAGASSARALAALLGLERPAIEEASLKDHAILGEIDFRHPLFVPFADPRFSDFSRIHFWKYRRLDAATIPSARVLARFDTGDPALVEVPLGHGRALVLTSCWDPEDSQLALSTKFVPLLYAILESSGAPAPVPAQYQVGNTVPLAKAGATVRTPDGSVIHLDAGQTNFSTTVTPGIYTLPSAQPPRRFAVNLDATESRTTPMSADEFERLGVPLARQERAVALEAQRKVRLQDAELEGRQRLWRLCLLAALGVLLVETWLAAKTTKRGVR